MSKKKQTASEKYHPGYDGDAGFGGRQPRISSGEKQKAANNPQPFESEDEKHDHPGYEG